MNCRHCNNLLTHTFIDLGFAPPSNAYLSEKDLNSSEIYFPFITLAASLKSPILPFVQLPINILSIIISVIFVFGFRPI